MPFLRFSRDSRGYESTFLMHASRRWGKAQHRILYWFRSPPNVKVGRAALDEDAIRWVEEHNPDVTFDWPKILEVGPPAPAPPADARRRRQIEGGKARDRARDGGQRHREETPPPPPQTAASAEASDASARASASLDVAHERSRVESQVEETVDQIEERIENEARVPEPDAARQVAEPAVSKILSREQLMSVRARFAELQARITEKGDSPERMEALRARAEGLNPDTWVTEDEVRKGMADFEVRIRDLRAALGLRRRRRSRRGGQRHRRAGAEVAGAKATAGLEEADEGGPAQPQGPVGETRDAEISPSHFPDEPNGEDDV